MKLFVLSAAVVGAAIVYFKSLRPKILDWNATPEEASRVMPGDDILPDATLQTTRAITVQAPPSAIWPWLLQMGPKPRGGVYT